MLTYIEIDRKFGNKEEALVVKRDLLLKAFKSRRYFNDLLLTNRLINSETYRKLIIVNENLYIKQVQEVIILLEDKKEELWKKHKIEIN